MSVIGMPAITGQSTGSAHFDSSGQDSLTKSATKKNVEESKMPDFHAEDQQTAGLEASNAFYSASGKRKKMPMKESMAKQPKLPP